MKRIACYICVFVLISGCTTKKQLVYLNNLSETGGEERFVMSVPDYHIQYRDILYVTMKALTPDGMITDFLSGSKSAGSLSYASSEAGQYLFGYDVNKEGSINIPVLGSLKVAGLTIEEARLSIQSAADKNFNNTTVECKLLSFKFTVIGEVRAPGTYVNYNNYLTVLEAIGRAGGISDFGRKNNILVIRPYEEGTKTYKLSLRDKSILTNEAYFLMPNDVVVVEPDSKKIFNLNLSTYSFILTSITSAVTTTILLLNYYK